MNKERGGEPLEPRELNLLVDEMGTTSKTTLADWLAAEPFHLSLSSSFFGMPCHAGFLQALLDAGLEPASVAGSSAGALVGTLWAAGLSVETMKAALEAAFAESADVLRVAVPWRRDGLPPEFGGVFSSAATQRVVQSILDAHPRAATRLEHCRVPAAVSVFDVGRLKTVVVREGPISDALSATMCVPGMFAPSVLADGRVALDGGVGDLSGLRALDHDASSLLLTESRIGVANVDRLILEIEIKDCKQNNVDIKDLVAAEERKLGDSIVGFRRALPGFDEKIAAAQARQTPSKPASTETRRASDRPSDYDQLVSMIRSIPGLVAEATRAKEDLLQRKGEGGLSDADQDLVDTIDAIVQGWVAKGAEGAAL